MKIKDFILDQNSFSIIAGPCAIESKEQFESIIDFLTSQGISMIRGGMFKLRTNPKDFQGLREKAFPIVKELKKKKDFLFISEITDPRQIEPLMDFVDIFQIGTRNMFNYDLLKELANKKCTVLLKRGFSSTIKEWTLAAEYLPKNQVILCERGIRTFETAYRNTLDINAIPYIKKNYSYPVFVDPSHGTGHSALVPDIAKASLVAGANGILIEVHEKPKEALSDSRQALNFDQFSSLMSDLNKISKAIDKKIV